MKILVLTKNYGRGYTGATSATYALIDQWTSEPDVTVAVATRHVVGPTNAGVTVRQYPSFKQLCTALAATKAAHPDCVGYSDDHLGYLFARVRIPYLHTYHGNWPDAFWQTGWHGVLAGAWLMPQYFATLKAAAQAVSVSRHMQRIVKWVTPVQVIYNGVATRPRPCVQLRHLKGPHLRILMVGGVDARKYRQLLQLLHRLTSTLCDRLTIDIDGPIHDQTLAHQLQAFPTLHLRGMQTPVPYQDYDVLLTTSTVENLSIAVVEALTSGLPVIGFNVGGLSEVVTPGRLGQLVAAGDLDGLADLLVRIVTRGVTFDFDNRQVCRLFSWAPAAEQYLTLLKRVSACSSSS